MDCFWLGSHTLPHGLHGSAFTRTHTRLGWLLVRCALRYRTHGFWICRVPLPAILHCTPLHARIYVAGLPYTTHGCAAAFWLYARGWISRWFPVVVALPFCFYGYTRICSSPTGCTPAFGLRFRIAHRSRLVARPRALRLRLPLHSCPTTHITLHCAHAGLSSFLSLPLPTVPLRYTHILPHCVDLHLCTHVTFRCSCLPDPRCCCVAPLRWSFATHVPRRILVVIAVHVAFYVTFTHVYAHVLSLPHTRYDFAAHVCVSRLHTRTFTRTYVSLPHTPRLLRCRSRCCILLRCVARSLSCSLSRYIYVTLPHVTICDFDFLSCSRFLRYAIYLLRILSLRYTPLYVALFRCHFAGNVLSLLVTLLRLPATVVTRVAAYAFTTTGFCPVTLQLRLLRISLRSLRYRFGLRVGFLRSRCRLPFIAAAVTHFAWMVGCCLLPLFVRYHCCVLPHRCTRTTRVADCRIPFTRCAVHTHAVTHAAVTARCPLDATATVGSHSFVLLVLSSVCYARYPRLHVVTLRCLMRYGCCDLRCRTLLLLTSLVAVTICYDYVAVHLSLRYTLRCRSLR